MKVLGSLVLLVGLVAAGFFGYQYWEEAQARKSEQIANQVFDMGTEVIVDATGRAIGATANAVNEVVDDVRGFVGQGARGMAEDVRDVVEDTWNTLRDWATR